MLSLEQFKKLYPLCQSPQEWIEAFKILPIQGINSNKRIAAFISQCGHESAGFTRFVENLNYSANGLNAVFPKYFKNIGIDANNYAKNPQKIANYIYANRMGNGSVESGDGYKYRGRGPIQLTGKNNYRDFSLEYQVDVLNNPDLVLTDKKISLLSAIWYWRKNNLNNYADKEDIKGLTKAINGGYLGLEERLDEYKKIMSLLGSTSTAIVSVTEQDNYNNFDFKLLGTLRRGSSGVGVILIQTLLGIEQLGTFGPKTEEAVKDFQRKHNLTPDGVVGPITLEKMLG